MPMNKFGEIVRSESSSNTSAFSEEVEEQFRVGRKKNFNLITLGIGIPLYSVIGYLVAEYFQYKEITGLTGAAIGAMIALICILVYDNVCAKIYGGYEYLVSLLSAGIVLAIISLLLIALYIFMAIVAVVFCLGIIITILAIFFENV